MAVKDVLEVLGGIGLGAGTMYLLDPDRGRRRRALVRDKFNRATHVVSREAGKTARDLRNRAQGVIAETTKMGDEAPSDNTLCERVRAAAGHVIDHPRQLEVKVNNGVVTLRGNLSGREHAKILKRVKKVPGVREIQDELSANGQTAAAGNGNWVRPAGLAAAGTAAGLLAAYGARRAGMLR